MKINRCISMLLTLVSLSVASSQAEAQHQHSGSSKPNGISGAMAGNELSQPLAQLHRERRSGFALMPTGYSASPGDSVLNITPLAAGPNLPVLGSGTIGRLTKWTGFTSSNSFIGETTIFEDKLGNIGIGTDTPTSRLTVAGIIETTLGGVKFPDGTIQTTAGLSSIFHDASLMGDGTSGSPLGIALGGVQTVHLANGAVTALKIANGTVVRSLNGLFDNVTLAAGANITITPAGNTLTIASSNSLTSITHDATLKGNGTSGSPLGVAVPLILSGSGTALIFQATNTTVSGDGMRGEGGRGGNGVDAMGGDNDSGKAGTGVLAQGGRASNDFSGGEGVSATGGDGDSGRGGNGVNAFGGTGSGAGHTGGDGIAAFSGAGVDGATPGMAGFFNGDVQVTGNLSKGGGSFKIDHPLDPENKYLYHSFVESPDMKNIYDGVVKLDSHGEAVVELPEWFGALNRDFRYLLTAIGAPAPNLFIAEKVSNNRFKIAGGLSGMEVSWQVTGIRQDAYANQHRIPVEEDKSERERGTYLHPDAFHQPEGRGVEWARHPDMMQRLKQRRIEAEQKLKQQPQ